MRSRHSSPAVSSCSSSTTASTCSPRAPRSRRALLRAAPRLTHARDEPRAASRRRRGRLPRPVARDPRSRAPSRRCRSSPATRPSACSSSGPRRSRRGSSSTDENADDVARICFRLDGLPLALELAAGRVGAPQPGRDRRAARRPLPPAARGREPAPTRQQTLEATLRWSHDLLEPGRARRSSAASAVFAGGFELGAAEAVCAGDDLGAAPRSPTSSAGSSRSRSSAPTSAVPTAATGCSRRSGSTPTSSSRRPARRTALAARHARWALALAEADARHASRSTARRRTSGPRSTRCSTATRATRCGSASR